MTMTHYIISAGAITAEYDAVNEMSAIRAYVSDAGYSSIEDAADACGESVDEFIAAIHIEEQA